MPVSCNPYRKIYLLQFIIHSACIQFCTCSHTAYAQSKSCCSSHCLTCHCFPSAPVARFLMGLHARPQAAHTNVGEFLKLDNQMDCNLATLAAGSQRGASFAIVKTAFNADLLSHSLCARCSRAAQVTANRLSRVRLLSQCPIPDKKWNEIIILIAAGGSCLSISHSLSLSVFARFVFALALSGCKELQLEEVISKCYLWRSFSVARLGQKLKIIFLLYGTHTQIESERKREGDTRNESLLPQKKLIFSVMWWEEKIKSLCRLF